MRMEPSSIKIWKLDEVPPELRSLLGKSNRPEWVALIPQRLYAPDIDEAIRNQWGPEGVARYETRLGDVIYAGYCAVDQFLKTIAAASRKDGVSSLRSLKTHRKTGSVHAGKR